MRGYLTRRGNPLADGSYLKDVTAGKPCCYIQINFISTFI